MCINLYIRNLAMRNKQLRRYYLNDAIQPYYRRFTTDREKQMGS